MKGPIHSVLPLGAALMIPLMLNGCASDRSDQQTEAQRQFLAGQDEAFAILERSGVPVVRVAGPFERPVIQWQEDMTLAQAILAAGYLDNRDPGQIIIQRGPTALNIDPAILLQGEDVQVQSGDVIHVLP